MTPHKQWLDNEYSQWIAALNKSTVHNFKEHPMVKRMLGEPDATQWVSLLEGNLDYPVLDLVYLIDSIGFSVYQQLSGTCARMIYYAQQILKRNPSSICEIGGGVGQFYAILRALEWEGTYWIFDLPEVRKFQEKYLYEVNKQTGLFTHQCITDDCDSLDMAISFYALGEFDDETKKHYESLVSACKHGYIAWNPHSGANDDLSIFDKHQITVTPGVEEGIKIIEW